MRDAWKPIRVSRRPPTKNPTPFSAFFEPVRIATHRYSSPCASSGTRSLTALFELIFVRSLAIPDRACEAITYGTTSHEIGANANMLRATHCVLSPASSVVRNPSRAATHPPTRFVTIPKIS